MMEKRIFTILLLTLVSIGFGQNLTSTEWREDIEFF